MNYSAKIEKLRTIIKNDSITHNEIDHIVSEVEIMRKEIKSIKNSEKKEYYEAEINDLENDIIRRKHNILLNKSVSQNKNLILLTESLKRLYECEEYGRETLDNLKIQNPKLQNLAPKIGKINSDLKKSDNLIKKMQKWWRG